MLVRDRQNAPQGSGKRKEVLERGKVLAKRKKSRDRNRI